MTAVTDLANHQPNFVYMGPLWWVFAFAAVLIFATFVLWWLYGPYGRRGGRWPHRRYRFRDGRNRPDPD